MPAKKKPHLRPVGAYPVKDHLKCPQITLLGISGDPELKVPDTDGARTRKESGIAFESDTVAAWLDTLAGAGWHVVNFEVGDDAPADVATISKLRGAGHTVLNITCSGERSTEARDRMYRATVAAMGRGVRLVIGARLVDDKRAGEPDALIREQPDGSRAKDWTYQGLDIKEHKEFEGTRKAREWMVSALSAPGLEHAEPTEATGTPQLVDSLQLAMYFRLLESHGRAGSPVGGIIGRSLTVVWRDLTEELYWTNSASALTAWDQTYDDFRAAQRHEEARLAGRSSDAPRSQPEWKAECKECPWRQVCREQLEEAGDITLLPDVTPRRAAVHRELGVSTVSELASLHRPTAALVDAGVDVAAALEAAAQSNGTVAVSALVPARQADLLAAHGLGTSDQLAALDERTARYSGTKVWHLGQVIDQARVHKAQRVHRARGVSHVEIPRAAIELDVDIEDDSGGICYLIGVRETVRTRGEVRTRYVPFVTWENTPEAEAKVFAEFWAYVMTMQEKARTGRHGTMRAYFYTEHESRYFRHLARSHAGVEGVPSVDDVEAFLTSDSWFDMQPVIGKQLMWPVEDRSLKSLAKYVKFFWRDETPGGANSVAWYREAVECAGSDPVRSEELRQRLLDYNEDDVDATWHLREWVSRLGEARRPGTKLPEVSELDRRWDKPRRRSSAA